MSEKFALEIDGVGKFDISTPELVKKAEAYFIENETEIPGPYRVKMASAIVAELGPSNAPESLLRYSHPVFRPEMQEIIRNESRHIHPDHSKEATELAAECPNMDNAAIAEKLASIREHRTNHVKIAHDMDPWQVAFPEAGKKKRERLMQKVAFEQVQRMSTKAMSRVLTKKAMAHILDGDFQYYMSLSSGIRAKLEEQSVK